MNRDAELRRRMHERSGDVVAVADVGERAPLAVAPVLAQRQHVGQRLAGMLLVAQRVDDVQSRAAAASVLALSCAYVRITSAAHPAFEVARDVLRAARARRRRIPGQVQRVAAELADRDLERRPRAQRGLLEEQRDVRALSAFAVGAFVPRRRSAFSCAARSSSRSRSSADRSRIERKSFTGATVLMLGRPEHEPMARTLDVRAFMSDTRR